MPDAPVTVAVVSWNTRDLLDRCLRSLQAYHFAELADVWVIDNASSDGSPEFVRDRYPWVRLVASEENLGFGRAVNRVAAETSSEWIATANADVALRPRSLEAMLEAGGRDPQAGAVAPRLVLPDGTTQHSVFAFPTITYSALLAVGAYRFAPALGDRYAIPDHWDSERARRVPWAVAAFLLFRRSAWDEVGGFDERQWMYAEDLDVGWRLKQSGWATRYEPRAVVDHESSASVSQLWGPELAPHWQRATYGFLARRRGPAYARAVALLNLVGAILRYAMVAARSSPPEARAAHWRWVLVQLEALNPRADLEALR